MKRPSTRHGSRSISSSSTSQKNVSLSSNSSPLSLSSDDSNLNKKIENNNSNLSLINLNIWSRDNNEEAKENDIDQSNDDYEPSIENKDSDDNFNKQLQELMKRRLNTTKNISSNLSKDNNFSSVVSVAEISDTETMRRNSFIKEQSIIFENNESAEELTETNNSRKSSIVSSTNASLKKTKNINDQIDANFVNINNEFTQKLTSESKMLLPIKNNNIQNNIINNNYCSFDTNLILNVKNDGDNKTVNLLKNKKNSSTKLLNVKQSNSSIEATNKININNLNNRFLTSTSIKALVTPIKSINQKTPFSSESFTDRNFGNNYNIWLKKKLKIDAEQRRIKNENQIKTEKQKEEKKREAEKCFNQWKKKSDNEMLKVRKKKLKAEQIEKERRNELFNEKKQNAERTFEHWKNTHFEALQLQHQRLATAEKIRADRKAKKKTEKKLEADQAFNEWLQHKENKLREEDINTSKLKIEQVKNEVQEKETKKKLAQEAYSLWLQMKNEELKYSKSLAYKILEFEAEAKKRWPTTPWLPTNNTVERKFISTGHRRMTLEKPVKLKVYKRTRSFH